MKYIHTFVIFLIFVLTGCIVDGSTESSYILVNNSNVKVKILPTNFMNDTLVLSPNESKIIDVLSEDGKNKNKLYYKFVDFTNPVVVTFADSLEVGHYNDTLAHTGKYYGLYSSRCFYNRDSYAQIIIKESKHSAQIKYIYTFTQQDYLDAQK